jgi:hypothetical protein
MSAEIHAAVRRYMIEGLELINISIVFLGSGFSPSSLSGDFLIEKGIVPTSWKVSANIQTPMLSQVTFQKGQHMVTVESNKVSFAQLPMFDLTNVEENAVFKNAKRYLEKQSHISYTASGNNFTIVKRMPLPEAQQYIREKYFSAEASQAGSFELIDAGANLTYNFTGGVIKFSVGAGEAAVPDDAGGKKIAGLVANVNFHRDLDSDIPNDPINALGKISDDWNAANDLVGFLMS